MRTTRVQYRAAPGTIKLGLTRIFAGKYLPTHARLHASISINYGFRVLALGPGPRAGAFSSRTGRRSADRSFIRTVSPTSGTVSCRKATGQCPLAVVL